MQALLWRGGVLSSEPISWPCYMVLASQAQNHPREVSQVVPLLISGSSHTSKRQKKLNTIYSQDRSSQRKDKTSEQRETAPAS